LARLTGLALEFVVRLLARFPALFYIRKSCNTILPQIQSFVKLYFSIMRYLENYARNLDMCTLVYKLNLQLNIKPAGTKVPVHVVCT